MADSGQKDPPNGGSSSSFGEEFTSNGVAKGGDMNVSLRAEDEARGEIEEPSCYRIKKVRNSYMLYGPNNLVVNLRRLQRFSDVSVYSNIIFIGDDPKFSITLENGKIKLTEIEDAEHEDTNEDKDKDDFVPKSFDVSEELKQSENVNEETEKDKVKIKTLEVETVLKTVDENKAFPFGFQVRQTDADVTSSDSHLAATLDEEVKISEENNATGKVDMKEAVNQTTETVSRHMDGKLKQKVRIYDETIEFHSDSLEVLPVFRKKLDKESFIKLWKQKFPLVEIRKKYKPETHRLVVILTGKKEKVEEAKAMLEGIGYCKELMFEDVKNSKIFNNIVDVLQEFFCLFQNAEDVLLDINEEKESIGICTSSSRSTNTVINAITKCIKRKEIKRQEGDPSFNSHLIDEIEHDIDEKAKPYIHMALINERLIMVYGLASYLQLCIHGIEEYVRSSLGKASEVVDNQIKEIVVENVIIEDPLVYEYFCKPGHLAAITKGRDISIKPPGFVIKGLREDVIIARNDIKALEDSIESLGIEIVMHANQKAELYEYLHQLDNSSVIVKKEEAKVDTISYESKKIQWIFPQGHAVTIAKTCLSSAEKALVTFEENPAQENQGIKAEGREIVVFVPKWKDGCARETTLLSKRFQMCLQECMKMSFQHIDVIVCKVSWKIPVFIKHLLPQLTYMLKKSPSLRVCFCGNNQKTCEDIYNECYGYFKNIKPLQCSGKTETVLMTVVGTKHEVASAVDTLTWQKGLILLEICSPKKFAISKPKESIISGETKTPKEDTEDSSGARGKMKCSLTGKRRMQASDDKNNVVAIGRKIPDRQYESIGATCRSSNWNADCKSIKEYKTNENICINVYEANILDLNDEFAEIESTQTSYFANKIKKEAKDTAEDSFSIIEEVPVVPENVWEVFYCSDQYKELTKKNNKISYNNGAIIFDPGMEECKDELQKLNEFVQELRKREWAEIHLEKIYQERSTVDKWCDETNETIGYECCKYIEDKGNVLVYTKTYEDVQTVKHVFIIKTGKIKRTARGRRGQASSDKHETNTNNVAGADKTNPGRQYESIGVRCRSPNGKADCKNIKEYKTDEDISVYVYEANILDLKVDCIVNTANESMQHGGGVAAVIARAAGYKLNDECFDYIRKNGKIPVGKVCTTTAGRLNYACVIHAVGPRWSDYYPKTHEKVKECETHLYQAVYNSFLEAENRGLNSIALPAISTAIFDVPEEICVSQYAKATLDYSRKTKDQPSALTEIHFIDKNKDIVKKIDSAFHSALIARDMPYYDINKFVKSQYRKGSQGFHAEAQASASNSIYGYSTKGASQSSSYAGFDASKVEPLSYFDDKLFTYVYLLHGKEEYNLIVSHGDMLKVKANAVVVPIDNQGRGGKIAESLIARIPKPYKADYYRTVSSKCHNARLCDVLNVPGYECGYPHILLAVYPASANDKDIKQRKHDVQKLYDNIFSTCNKQPGIHAVVTTLLGADMRSAEDIKTCAEMFLQSYLKFYSKPLMKDKLRIHLVCKEDLVYHCVKWVLDMYVMSRKSELEKTLDDNDSSPPSSATDDVKPDDIVATGEGENCIICEDTITDPEKLKCGHVFCKDCIQAQFKFKQACPICGQVCGIITGDQPEGYMNYTTERYSDCSGYEGCGRIVITYTFPPGRQEENHPSPGTFYKGITRVAYLPNNEEGGKILEMLKIAFKRKLVFTIGNSRTTGQEGVITWNDIHHKTNPKPYSQFGYPDPDYLERVKDELAVKGVTEKDINN